MDDSEGDDLCWGACHCEVREAEQAVLCTGEEPSTKSAAHKSRIAGDLSFH